MNWIGVVDCNNFFVSCERLFRPDLQNRPTVVLSGNDGCVVARSPEIKSMGIPMGVPYFKVRKELEQVNTAVFSSNFALYRDISARVMNVLQAELDRVEQYSVDEAFFELHMTKNKAQTMITDLKSVIEQQIGIPVSVGLARTKTIAKQASEVAKRDCGTCILEGNDWREVSKSIPVREIWGIGGKTAQKLNAHHVHTVSDLVACDPARIEQLFGVAGTRMVAELNEQVAFVVCNDRPLRQGIMSTRSFRSATTELSVLEDAVAHHVSHAAEELREAGGVARGLRVLIQPSRHGDWAFRGGSKETVLVTPTDDTRALLREAFVLVQSLYEAEVPYKKAGVILFSISPNEGQQGSFFEDEDTLQHSREVLDIVDGLNNKFGTETITMGRYFQTKEWQTSREKLSPAYTTKWKEIPKIKA